MKLAILDYGAGNLRSIENACKHLGINPEIISNPDKLKPADKIILPGVGNFGDAMKKLEKFREIIIELVDNEIPFLGLCLGIQVILERSEESPKSKGLSIFKGYCKRFPSNLKVPHIGWNSIKIVNKEVPILKGISSGDYFYFVHSYYPIPKDEGIIAATTEYWIEFPSSSKIRVPNLPKGKLGPKISKGNFSGDKGTKCPYIAATTEYGVKFPSVIAKGNVFATQFHPEKSGKLGLKILENFLQL